MPSRVTVVPGSHGPRQSGSVTTPTWQASTLASFMSTAGLGPVSDGPSDDDSVVDDDDDVGGIGELAVSHCTNSHKSNHLFHINSQWLAWYNNTRYMFKRTWSLSKSNACQK